MRSLALGLAAALLLVAAPALAAGPAGVFTPAPGPPAPLLREPFYCQPPVWGTINASNGYQSEIADDIPVEYTGYTLRVLRFYAAEWLAPWQTPDGLWLRFYDEACPPPPDTYLYDEWRQWSELSPVFLAFIPANSMTIYEITVELLTPLTVTTTMSVGVQLQQSWGQEPPYAGFCFTAPGSYAGCAGFFWDNFALGVPRWTPATVPLGVDADLAYCLFSDVVPAPESVTVASWGRVKALFR